jgi:hypothetical protein
MSEHLIKKKVAACTIVSRNYAAYAKTLADSLATSNSKIDFYVLLVDIIDLDFEKSSGLKNIVWVENLGIPSFKKMSFKFDILELNTNVKPFFLKKLAGEFDYVFYFDPDIFVFGSLENLIQKLEINTAILTPHIISPIDDNKKPSEIDFLKAGSYNLGFIGVRSCDESIRLLDWWARRCAQIGFNDTRQGLFVDQRFIDLVPSLFEGIVIERSVAYNVAYWNLHERLVAYKGINGVVEVNDLDLVFFHFSGISIDQPTEPRLEISKYQDRSNFANRPDVKPLFDDYRALLESNRHRFFNKISYSFGCFSNGEIINGLSRRVFSMIENEFDGNLDPFDAKGPVYKQFKADGFLKEFSQKTFNTFTVDKKSRSLVFMQFLLRIAFKILGPERYSMLMIYFGYISSIRNQKEILLPKK